MKYKEWYGKRIDKNGTVYKRFISLNIEQTTRALTQIRSKKTVSITKQFKLNEGIPREGNYLFLNLTQAELLGFDRNYNTAIYIK